MRILLLIILLGITTTCFAQETKKDKLMFEGYLFSEDSVPIENAFLVNFRTSKIVTTNKLGFFRISLESSDSVMITHLSQNPLVIYAKNLKRNENIIYITNRSYLLNPVPTSTKVNEQQYIDENMDRIKEKSEEPSLEDIKSQSGNVNPYDTEEDNPGATILKIKNKTSKKETQKTY